MAGVLVIVLMVSGLGMVLATPNAAASPSPAVAASPQTSTPDIGWTSPMTLEPQVPTNANLGGVALAGDQSGMVVWEKDGLYATIMATHFVPGAGDGGTNWEAPVNLSSPGCWEYSPQVAMDAYGDAMAVWLDTCGYAIRASLYQPGVGWSSSVTIDQYGSPSFSPMVAMDGAGDAFVTWVNWDGAAHHVYANRYVWGTGWGLPVRVDPTSNDSAGANVGIDDSGNAIITWYRNDGGTLHVYAARYSGAAWSAPVLLESSSNYALYPTVAVDSLGNAVVAWIEWDGTYNVWGNRFDGPNATWTGAVLLESQTAWPVFQPPRVSMNNGNAVVVWGMGGPGSDPYSVFANRYVAGVGWQGEADVDLVGGSNYYTYSPNVALDSAGNATIVFQLVENIPSGPAYTWNIAIRYDVLTGVVASWNYIDYNRLGAGRPLLAMDSSGNALAVWNINEASATNPINGIMTNRYVLGVGWAGLQQAEWDENLQPAWLQLESNAAGDAIFSWTQYDGPIWHAYAALYTPSRGWGAPTRLEDMRFSSVAEEWSAMDGQGNAIVLFKTSDGTQYNVYASYYSVRTGWGTPHRLDTATGSAKYWLRVEMNRNGEGAAIWQEYNGVQWNAYSSFFDASTQTWSAPLVIQAQFSYIGSAAVGIDGNGDAMAAYYAYNGTGYSNYASYYQPGSGWGSPVHLALSSAYMGSVPYQVASNDQGDFAVSWNEWDGAHYDAVASVFTPQAGWSRDTFLASGPGNSGPAIPSLDGSGDTMVVYELWDGAHDDAYAVTKPVGGVWGTPVLLSGGITEATQVTSALDSQGNGYAAWTQFNGYGWDLMARRYLAGQGWLPVTVITTPNPATPSTNSGNALLAVDGHGDAILGWNQWHQGVLVPYAAEYIVGSGAPNLAVSSPGDNDLTSNRTVTVSGTTDPGATVTVDGTAVSVSSRGSFSASYTLADGTHTFSVVATNGAGLTQTATRTVTVDTTAPALTLTSPSSGLLTRDPVVQVSGTTEPGATVVVNGVSAAVSPSGTFSVALSLHEGADTISATATDAAGNQAQASVGVTLDTTPPAIVIASPRSGANYTSPTVTVTGTTEPGATLVVDGQAVAVDANGLFSVQLSLSEGTNLITATATDAAGNSATTVVAVSYTNPAPAAAVQSSIASLSTMNLILIILVVVSLALGVFEMVQIRKLRARKAPEPNQEPSAPKIDL